MRDNFKSYSLSKAKEIMAGLGLGEYRGTQIFKWLWQKNVQSFSDMTDISKESREYLARQYVIEGPKIAKVQREDEDAQKYLLKLEDGTHIESVFILEGRRKTICVSSQVGCPLGCKFCATGLLTFQRNLAAYEIADQVRLIQHATNEKCTNVVFMGMGEPLLNLPEVIDALATMSSSLGLGIGRRHTTVSTVGLVEGMEMLLKSSVRVKLAVSLNFVDEDMRKEFMPAARSNPLREILKLAKKYSSKKDMVTFEYVMISGINDSLGDAQRLIRLLKGIPSKINLIPYNEHPRLIFKRPADERVQGFYESLLQSRHTVVIRKSRGQKILAGCGQLAGTDVMQ